MTELLYQRDAYLRSFSAVVTAVDDEHQRVALDRTAFYPGGGGQPSDTGTLSGRPVTRAQREGDHVWHTVDSGELPRIGTTVEGELDWSRRYLLMRTHSALHVLCGVVWRDLRAQVTGGNMEPGKGRLDFELANLTRELVDEIETKCNEELAAARDIEVSFLTRQAAEEVPDLVRTKVNLLPDSITEIRTVEIVGLDTQADGGTHVANTSEIGAITVPKYKSKGAINKRLYIAVGD